MLHGKTAAAVPKQGISRAGRCCACNRRPHHRVLSNDPAPTKLSIWHDFIEETRDFKGVEPARAIAGRDLDQALLYCFDYSLKRPGRTGETHT